MTNDLGGTFEKVYYFLLDTAFSVEHIFGTFAFINIPIMFIVILVGLCLLALLCCYCLALFCYFMAIANVVTKEKEYGTICARIVT